MIPEKLISLLNNQIKLEAVASMEYMAMATWSEVNGYNGVGYFFYKHSEEEYGHMVKLIKFMNGRGSKAIIPNVGGFSTEYKDLHDLFSNFLKSEKEVTEHVNQIVGACLNIKDYITHNFMQWYVSEQMEEESLAINTIDKLNMIGNDKGGLFLFDRELGMYDGNNKQVS